MVEVNNSKKLAEGINYLIENEQMAMMLSDNAQLNSSKYIESEIVKRWLLEIRRLVK